MYPSDLPVSTGTTTRKHRPLPPRPSQQQNHNHTAYSGNRTPHVPSLSSPSTDSARRSNESPTKAPMKRDDIVGPHTPSESENISDHTACPNAIVHAQWKRLGFIGKGSYGQVYRALDFTTGYIFAVKEVNSKIKRQTLVQALQDERKTLKELEHPNIVRYLGFEEDQGVLNIFLEYVPGGTIRSCLNTHGKFKEEVTKSFASQILQGLSYLHSKSILHRDLKSENILVDPQGICKISDFGISKKALETDRGRLYSSMRGTIAYMAPEMIEHEKKGYDCKIDIWSVGCIVFEMWTGKTPWSGMQDVQILMKLFAEKLAPPLPDDILLSTTAESFRQEFFHFDPEKRPLAVKLLQHTYLKLLPQWTFPRVDEIGQVPNTCSESESIAPTQKINSPHVTPSRNDTEKGTIRDREEESPFCESIYSDIEAIAAEMNFSTSNRATRSMSRARSMYSDVADPRSPSPALITLTPPLRPRKQGDLPNNLGSCMMTSSNTRNQPSPLHATRTRIHNTDPDNPRKTGSFERRRYVYQPPPLPDLNNSPYSQALAPPISIRIGKPSSQVFSRPINLSKLAPTKLTNHDHGISTNLPSSLSSSVAQPKLGYSVSQREVSCMPLESDDDDDERYSPSAWTRPPVDIPIRLSRAVKPVESVSDLNIPPIHRPHRPSPSAIPRPSIEAVYKDILSENIDVPNAGIARSKRRYTMKSIREVVEERLYQAQVDPAQSPQRANFWNSHMKEIKA